MLPGPRATSRREVTPQTAGALAEGVPVLVGTTFHPHWRRADGRALHAASPCFMLTFVREPTQLVFGRGAPDRAGIIISAAALLFVGGSVVPLRPRRRPG